MNKYLSSMKKNYIYGILIILLIASIILGYFLYKEKKEYAITTQNQYNFALYELIDYVQDLENYLALTNYDEQEIKEEQSQFLSRKINLDKLM